MPTEGTVAQLAIADDGFLDSVMRATLLYPEVTRCRRAQTQTSKRREKVLRRHTERGKDLGFAAAAQMDGVANNDRDEALRFSHEVDKATRLLSPDDKVKLETHLRQQHQAISTLKKDGTDGWEAKPSAQLEGLIHRLGRQNDNCAQHHDGVQNLGQQEDDGWGSSTKDDGGGWGSGTAPNGDGQGNGSGWGEDAGKRNDGWGTW